MMMRYRTNRKTGDRISEIGIGSAYLFESGMDEGVRALRLAVEGGINYFDLAAGDERAFPIFGEGLADVRKSVFFQVHFGAEYSKGTYGWSLDLDVVKASVDRQLKELKTDYIDYGFIHCLDEEKDWETYQRNGVYEYILQLKEEGVVHHIALSSHTPSIAQRVMNDVDISMLMFSINPAYDYGQGEYANGAAEERVALYRRCETDGVGITVMKPFSGGQLLEAKLSPFGQALTQYQCLRYALDRPGVLCAIAGAADAADVKKLLAYCEQPEEETDYSVIGTFTPPDVAGKCVYCNHCKPCPAGIDVGLVNKYYDLAKAGDFLAKEHYLTLRKNASDCTGCGHCDSRCPFGVHQSMRMQEIRAYMEL